MPPARQTAKYCTLAEMKSGAWTDNIVELPRGTVNRVNILGVVVEKGEKTIVLDDGSSTMVTRSFEAEPSVAVGDMALIVGRPRAFNDEKYIVIEICKKLTNPGWVAYRKKELALLGVKEENAEQPDTVQEPKDIESEVKEETADSIIAKIRELDTGNGAPVDELIKTMPNAEELLKPLFEGGDVFEVRPGMVKVLE
ncbi:MAG: hypothetical protein OXR66_03600 [Candidatus Woesearchaeota archaeon]|nr:hypothetical protein [Candidatus Woesearchaeota archaeon]